MHSLYDAPDLYCRLFDARAEDLRFYLEVAALWASPRVLLEVGAGTGRVTVALARAGHEVWAVESSGPMRAALEERLANEPPDVRTRVRVVPEDACGTSLGRRFGGVVAAFNTLAHFETDAKLTALLARVREHLVPDGVFAFDTWNPSPRILSGARTETPTILHASSRSIRCTQRYAYEPIAQMLEATIEVHDELGRTTHVHALRLRQFFPRETLTLLEQHGFHVGWRTDCFAHPSAWGGEALRDDGRVGEVLAYVTRAKGKWGT